MVQQARVNLFSVSADGYGSGEGQSRERPFGHLDPLDLHGWIFSTAHVAPDAANGSRGLDDVIVRDYDRNIGAEIMGRHKFTPERGLWSDPDWKGWWGDDPPFRVPVFVLTHYPRPPLTLSDTTFHFIEATPLEALERAKAAANGKDVRIGGGVATIREFLEADLIDAMQVTVIPFEAGRGERLWKSPHQLDDRFHHEVIPSPTGVTHHFFWKNNELSLEGIRKQ